jgi:hypothetical protein
MHGEGVVVDAHINVIFIDTGDFKFQSDVVLIFGELVARKRILHLLPGISALSVHDGPA